MKLNGLDLNKLHVFGAVVESVLSGQGYRGASERLGLTRSAISQSITALETQIGKPLFLRSGVTLVPTEDALVFHEEITRYRSGLESALDRLHHREISASGLLRIGAYLEFTKSKLMPVIEDFLTENPRTQMQFHFDSPSRLEALLEKGKIDLAISIQPHRMRGVETTKLYEEELCLVGRRDLVSRRPTASELAKTPVIDYFPSHQLYRRWWSVHFSQPPTRVWTRAYAATAEMVLEMAERRLGVGVIPRYLIERASERMQVIAPTPAKLTDYLWMSSRRSRTPSAAERAFLRALQHQLR